MIYGPVITIDDCESFQTCPALLNLAKASAVINVLAGLLVLLKVSATLEPSSEAFPTSGFEPSESLQLEVVVLVGRI